MKSNLMKQILRFAVVGGSAFLIDYVIMIVLTEYVGINYLLSSGISFTVSVIYNYLLSIFWVFEVDENKSKANTFIVFIILSIIGLGINQLVMYILVDVTTFFPYFIAKLFATGIVMVYNFITRKIFLEKKETK